MNRPMIGHEAISASAGSGKTFQLAHRYIRLLANDVKPDRIVALTFSRKAAAEIFDSIVRYLIEASISPGKAIETGERIGKPSFTQNDFLRLLRELMDSLHRLHVGTLDSFTIGVIRAFPMELGIPPDFRVVDSDGAQAKSTRQEVLERIFDNRYVDRASQGEFMEAFKQATFGQEEKSLQRSLYTFIGEYRNHYHILPAQDAWGYQDIIWPSGSTWLATVDDVDLSADALEKLLAKDRLPDKVMNRWHAFINTVRTFRCGAQWTRDVDYLFEKLVEDIEGLRCGKARIRIDRTAYELSIEGGRLALALIAHVMNTEINGVLERTRGVYRVLDQYEWLYDDMVRRRGKLTFADAQRLLTSTNRQSGGAVMSRIPGEDLRLYIDYRLDCRLDHWLLDEFQDTSDVQWEVLGNLADEILQDTSGERSFFYVGDVKQAIYGWRGGNARLFGNVLAHYEGLIEEKHLNTSFRSCQPVIDTVNQVFGNLPAGDLPSGAVRQWDRIWQEHRCQKDVVPDRGYVALLEPQCCDDDGKPEDEDRYRVVGRLLREIAPLDRGLSVAILVRSNESGRKVVNFLRRECSGMNIVHEGKAAIKDNPVVSLFLSLVKFAAHPGDTFAWRHLQMSPLERCIAEKRLDRDKLPLVLLREIHMFGFQTLVRDWGAQLERVHPLDDFGRKRLKDLISAAGEFDETGSRDCNTFLRFIDNYEIHELGVDDAVRVMTIHQSKGLGFDIVMLPDLQKGSVAQAGHIDFVTARDPNSDQPLWSLKMPRRLIAESDPVLASQVRASDEAACFDALCVLYVALTRAKQGLYIITSFPGKASKTVTSAAFLKTQLAGDPKPLDGPRITIDGEEFICHYEAGQRDWYMTVRGKDQLVKYAEQQEIPLDFCNQPSERRRLVRVSASTQSEHKRSADELFSKAYRDSLDFGTAVHQLFEKVSWAEEVDIEDLVEKWWESSAYEEELKGRVVEHFRKTITSEDVRQILSKPSGNVELWRERRFEIILENQWVTGAFDRVTVVRDANGKAHRATLLDFKTDEIVSESELTSIVERYRPQLALYRKALSRILRLDPSQITLQLLFTHPGKILDLM